MINKKKSIIFIVVAILIVAVVSVGTVCIFKVMEKKNTSQTTTQTTKVTKAQADDTKAKAQEAIKANNTASAKTLLQAEVEQYKQLGDTNAMIDAQAQLYLIEHAASQPKKAAATTTSSTTGK